MAVCCLQLHCFSHGLLTWQHPVGLPLLPPLLALTPKIGHPAQGGVSEVRRC